MLIQIARRFVDIFAKIARFSKKSKSSSDFTKLSKIFYNYYITNCTKKQEKDDSYRLFHIILLHQKYRMMLRYSCDDHLCRLQYMRMVYRQIKQLFGKYHLTFCMFR